MFMIFSIAFFLLYGGSIRLPARDSSLMEDPLRRPFIFPTKWRIYLLGPSVFPTLCGLIIRLAERQPRPADECSQFRRVFPTVCGISESALQWILPYAGLITGYQASAGSSSAVSAVIPSLVSQYVAELLHKEGIIQGVISEALIR